MTTTLVCAEKNEIGILLLGEEGSALLILGSSSVPADVTASPRGDSDNDGHEEKDSHDDKGKDPLEGDNLAQELRDTEGSREDAEGKSHGVILYHVSFEEDLARSY